MKKTLLLLVSIAFGINILKAQVTVPGTPPQICTCNPNGWQPVRATVNKRSTIVKCGYQFSLKCNDAVTLNSNYKCLGNCNAKYIAELKNNTTSSVVMNYASFTFPWNYHFTTAGNYSLEITPLCGDHKCTPCRFFFTVVCPVVACECDSASWKPFIAYFNNGANHQTVNCGFQFSVKKNQPFRLAGQYICKGGCKATYHAELKNNETGAIIRNYPVFTFPWLFTFIIAGNYKLEIIPVCGNKKCTPCVFYFTVT